MFKSNPPTLAELAIEDFLEAKKTISLVTTAVRRGAVRSFRYPWRIFQFTDGSKILASGTGRSLKINAYKDDQLTFSR